MTSMKKLLMPRKLKEKKPRSKTKRSIHTFAPSFHITLRDHNSHSKQFSSNVKGAIMSGFIVPVSEISSSSLNACEQLLTAVLNIHQKVGLQNCPMLCWEAQTKLILYIVQHECIPQAVLGMDIICQAKSGMGKTAVFVLATLHQVGYYDPSYVSAYFLMQSFPFSLSLFQTKSV